MTQPDPDPRLAAWQADAAALVAEVPAFASAAVHLEGWTPGLRPPGFATLLGLILEQQVSVAAGAAMWRRLTETLTPVTPDGFLTLDDETLRACGFSRPKLAYGRGLARAVADGALDLDALETLEDEVAIADLTALKGIGRWTAECYLLFALGRRDVLPAADLALLVGWQALAGLPERPKPEAFRDAAEPWRPRRTAASLLLWRVYRAEREREKASAKPATKAKTGAIPPPERSGD